MIKCELIVPDAPDRRATLEAQLTDDFGGFTKSFVSGAWRDDAGRTVRDDSLRYETWLTSWEQLPAFMRHVRTALSAFRQEAIAYTVAGIPEIYGGK